MRFVAIALLTATGIAGSGCLIVPRARPVAAKSCPPGHVWSDGSCHSKGKGNDPGHHEDKGGGKAKGKDKDTDK